MSYTCVSESQRRLTASSIYSAPLKPWETRVLRLEPSSAENEENVVEVHLEIAVIPHVDGLGLVETGEVVNYEALSYTWGSNVFSHAVRCNGLDFSVTPNLHEALVHLRGSHTHRWLWVDALCINQYDNAEKERQVRNMFHIYRKASTVLVWLGPAGPDTFLGAGIVNFYDAMWQELRHLVFGQAIEVFLARKRRRDSDINIYVDEFLHDLQERQSSDDERSAIDKLGLLSMALNGIIDICGRAWVRRTWIIQEFAAASNIEFHCGQSVLSYDAFCTVMPRVGVLIWGTRNLYLAGEEAARYAPRLDHDPLSDAVDLLSTLEDPTDCPVSLREFSVFTKILHDLRLLVNDPAHYIESRCTQVELMLGLLVETASHGFEVSIAVDRLYSMMAMADWISSPLWGLRYNKRVTSSPQQLPVDYSVRLQDAVLRALKIRMNEVGCFYLAIQEVFRLGEKGIGVRTDQKTKAVLFSMCTAESAMPSWLRLLEFNCDHCCDYLDSVEIKKRDEIDTWSMAWRFKYPLWAEQDTTDPCTLLLRGKALGRLVVDSEKNMAGIWVELPCPLGQEFERALERQRPIRPLHHGCPDGQAAAADEVSSGDTGLWSWQFPPSAKSGDIVVVFPGTCAVVRPIPGQRYIVVQHGLRVPVGSPRDSLNGLEYKFLHFDHGEDLEDFILV